jgi:hypothetical protein
MKNQILFLFVFVLLFCSCENTKMEKRVSVYFDFKTYFDNQAAELTANNFRIKKIVLKDDVTTEKMFDHPDWKTELNPFSECDINKPSWKNSYTIDSTGDSGIYCIKYFAKDSALKIKSINFCVERDSLTFIRIEKRTDNMYYNNITTLSYFPRKAYSIRNSQKITFTKGSEVEVKALFLR